MDTMRLVDRVRIEDLPEDTTWPKHEILDGTLIVTPYAGLAHQGVVTRLVVALAGAAPAGVVVYPGANVRHMAGGEADLLVPDVVVARAGAGDGTYLAPTDVLLAVEVVSPGSRTMDTVTKRVTYAAWGVPAYLVVDPGAAPAAALTWHGEVAALPWAVDAAQAAMR